MPLKLFDSFTAAQDDGTPPPVESEPASKKICSLILPALLLAIAPAVSPSKAIIFFSHVLAELIVTNCPIWRESSSLKLT